MRSYGLTYRGKDEGRWKGKYPIHYCSCCYGHNQGFIIYGRNREAVRRVKRSIKRKARQQAKTDTRNQLEEFHHEPTDQPPPRRKTASR